MLPKALLTSHSRMCGSRWVTTPLSLFGSLQYCLYSSSVFYYHLFLISSVSLRSLPFLSFHRAHSWMKFSLDISNFHEGISVLFHSIVYLFSLHCSRKKAFFSLLTILWNSAFRWVCLSFFLCLWLLSSALWKASLDNQLAFLHFFFFGVILINTCCTMLQTSVHSFSGSLYTRSDPLNLFVISTVKSWGFWFRSYLNGLVFFPTFFNSSLNFAVKSSWATVSSGSYFCWLYRASLSLATKNIINLISVLIIWWCLCVESSLVSLEEGVCYDQCVLLTKLC